MSVARKLCLVFFGLLLIPNTGMSGLSAPLSEQGPQTIRQSGKARRGQRNPQRNPNRGGPRNNLAPIQDVVEGFYVSRFQRALELDDSQFARVLPALRESLEKRTELGRRRSQELGQLRQALRSGASDDEIVEKIRNVDRTDLELRAVQESLLKAVDPELSPTQRARLRIVQPDLEQRIRSLIERSRNPGRRPPPPPG
jgi:hypothetical protein